MEVRLHCYDTGRFEIEGATTNIGLFVIVSDCGTQTHLTKTLTALLLACPWAGIKECLQWHNKTQDHK